jgi:hypothetical protein
VEDEEVFDIDANRVTIENITVRNGESDGIECDGNRCRFLKIR